jgi:hypothetical protein
MSARRGVVLLVALAVAVWSVDAYARGGGRGGGGRGGGVARGGPAGRGSFAGAGFPNAGPKREIEGLK